MTLTMSYTINILLMIKFGISLLTLSAFVSLSLAFTN